jgi:hypothetical protein
VRTFFTAIEISAHFCSTYRAGAGTMDDEVEASAQRAITFADRWPAAETY